MDTTATDQLLSTTRAVRQRLDLERPVEPEMILECLRLAVQAPTGSKYPGLALDRRHRPGEAGGAGPHVRGGRCWTICGRRRLVPRTPRPGGSTRAPSTWPRSSTGCRCT